jgi:hypothetical protein
LKIPKFLGVYPSKKGEDGLTVGLSIKSIRFNVAWNIWREVAEWYEPTVLQYPIYCMQIRVLSH